MSESKYIQLDQVMANAKKHAKNKEPKPERVSVEAEREKLMGSQPKVTARKE